MDLDYICDTLKEKGYLENGKTIPKELMENLLNVKACDSITWKGPIMQIMDALKLRGYFSTTRNVPLGCLRILEIKEYAHKAKNSFLAGFKKNKKNKVVLDKCTLGNLDDRDAKNIYHVRNLIILHEHAMKSVLSDL